MDVVTPLRLDRPRVKKALTLDDWIAAYRNDREGNTSTYWAFDEAARRPAWLASHRTWVEDNAWGFGDRALHHMWLLLVEHLAARRRRVRCLEIGVYKGQVISLWALIAARRGLHVDIAAVSPFAGSEPRFAKNRVARALLKFVDAGYRSDVEDGNVYAEGAYLADCARIFAEFRLDFGRVETVRGLSTDANVLSALADRPFDLVYIDGDHSEAGAVHDVRAFAPHVTFGGFVVLDDASLALEMDLPYRGRPGPSKAAEYLPALGFHNVLNVGHNRVFQRVKVAPF
jgi:hypothetical protein